MPVSLTRNGFPQAARPDVVWSDHEARLQRIRSLVRMMDEAFTIPGTNFKVGMDSLIGLLPVAGDLVSAAVALYIVREAAQLGAPKWLLARMTWNVGVDAAVGAVPVAGDLFDVAWKANRKNLRLLERWLEKQERRGAR